jgi:hypothetical protein
VKASDWTYLRAVDMTIVSMETGIPVETTYREFETPTIASLIQSGAKFRIDNQGTLVAYDPETEATLAELIDPDYWEWKYASDVENLDLPSVVKFDVSVWDAMDQPARDSVKDALPVSINYLDAVTNETVELTRGGFSTVKDNLVKFYDGGLLVQVYDFENGKYMTPEQAGIIEFLLTDSTTWEIPYFGKDQAQEAVNFMANDGAMGAYADFGKSTEISTYALTRFNKLVNFNRQFKGGGTVQYDGDPKGGAAFAVSIADYGAQNTFLTYMTPDFKFNTIMLNVSAKAAAGMMSLKQVTAPDPL